MLHNRTTTGNTPHKSLTSEAPPPRKHDERGITLQTLIVTAVLVLVAAASSVIIIAITRSSNDDLEAQQSDSQARCEPWEIFDPSLAARGIGAGNGGLRSSSIGCVRACYIEFARHGTDWTKLESNLKGSNGEDSTSNAYFRGARILDNAGLWGGPWYNGNTYSYIDLNGQDVALNSGNAKLLFSRKDIYDTGPEGGMVTTVAQARQRYPVIGNRVVGLISDQGNEIDLHIGQITGKPSNWLSASVSAERMSDRTSPEIVNLEIRVSNNQQYCSVWDTVTGDEISALRSQN